MYERILVPVDGSATSSRALDEAIRLAVLSGAKLRLVHVADELSAMTGLDANASLVGSPAALLHEGGEQILAQAKMATASRVADVDTVLVDGFSAGVANEVLEQATLWNADLIVLGTHGRRGLRRLFMGSDAEQIVRRASAPVLLVRAAPPA